LADLSRSRPIFHSEADFQLAFAWQMRLRFPEAQIRLERQVMPLETQRIYLDMEVSHDGQRTAFELKYLTRAFSAAVNGELFSLRQQGAPDTRRYDVIKDIGRIEVVVKEHIAHDGFVVALTNDAGYWLVSRRGGTNDADFRIHEGRELAGPLDWAVGAAPGTKTGREEPLIPTGTYKLKWSDFSVVAPGRAGAFRYLLIQVPE
jgi:hypothetical protein